MRNTHITIGRDKHKQHPAHSPYMPSPPSQEEAIADAEISYSESEAVIDSISGTNIKFGKEQKTEISGNKSIDVSTAIHQRIGNGKIVSNIGDIYGQCPYCEKEAEKAYKKGRISLEEAYAKSFIDIPSVSVCDKCGTKTCGRHTRPVKMQDEIIEHLCKRCLKKHKRKQFIKNLFKFLITPFLEDQN